MFTARFLEFFFQQWLKKEAENFRHLPHSSSSLIDSECKLQWSNFFLQRKMHLIIQLNCRHVNHHFLSFPLIWNSWPRGAWNNVAMHQSLTYFAWRYRIIWNSLKKLNKKGDKFFCYFKAQKSTPSSLHSKFCVQSTIMLVHLKKVQGWKKHAGKLFRKT